MTNLISRERGEGKTHDLIITSAMTGYPIVCYNERSVEHVKNMAKEMGYEIPTPKSMTTLNHYKPYEENILVDDLQFFLEEMLDKYFGSHVVTSTITISEDNHENRK